MLSVEKNKYYAVTYSPSIEHHGIKGQKWGKRNGPPYPLDAEDHSAREKKAGWRRSLDSKKHISQHAEKKQGFKLSDKQKKYLKIGAAVAVAGLAMYGAYKLSGGGIVQGEALNRSNLHKYLSSHIKSMSPEDHIRAINPYFGLNSKFRVNCARCTAAYDLRKRGYDVTAGMVGHNGTSLTDVRYWYQDPATGKPRPFSSIVLPSALNLSDTRENYEDVVKNVLESFGDGARGHFFGEYSKQRTGHDIIWEIRNGKVCFMDAQNGKVFDPGDVHSATKLFDYKKKFQFLRTDDLDINEAYITENTFLNGKSSGGIVGNIKAKDLTFDQAYKMGKSVSKKLENQRIYDYDSMEAYAEARVDEAVQRFIKKMNDISEKK